MNILFKHVRGERSVTVEATVVYNIAYVTDMFIVLPKSHTHELGEIINFFRSDDNNWWSDSMMGLLHPETFVNLLGVLTVLFSDHQFKFLEDAPHD